MTIPARVRLWCPAFNRAAWLSSSHAPPPWRHQLPVLHQGLLSNSQSKPCAERGRGALQTPDHLKTQTCEEAFNPDGLAQRSIALLKDTFPDLEVCRPPPPPQDRSRVANCVKGWRRG